MNLNKKAAWGWEMIGKLILVLIVILVLLVVIGLLTGHSYKLWEGIKALFTFGG